MRDRLLDRLAALFGYRRGWHYRSLPTTRARRPWVRLDHPWWRRA